MSDESLPPDSMMRCSTCRGLLEQSGPEPFRFICTRCAQNFFAVMRLVPVPPRRALELPEVSTDDAGRGT